MKSFLCSEPTTATSLNRFLKECGQAEILELLPLVVTKEEEASGRPVAAVPTLQGKYTHRCELTMWSKEQGRNRSPDPQSGSTGHNH